MKPNPNANPIMVAFPKGVPPSNGSLPAVDEELVEAEDEDDPFVVVGDFVIGAAVV